MDLQTQINTVASAIGYLHQEYKIQSASVREVVANCDSPITDGAAIVYGIQKFRSSTGFDFSVTTSRG